MAVAAETTDTKMEKDKGRAVFSPWGSTHAIEYLKTSEPLNLHSSVRLSSTRLKAGGLISRANGVASSDATAAED